MASLFDRFARRNSALSTAQQRQWEQDGFLILPGFYSEARIEKMRHRIDRLWEERRAEDNPLVADIFLDSNAARRLHFRDAPDEARSHPYKLNDVYLSSSKVRNFVLSEELAAVLKPLLDGEAIICNSLIFERGSQQQYHFDSWYMPPTVENKMLATWIALEDVHEDAGPLSYYPGSHLIPPYRFGHGGILAVDEEMPACREYVERELKSRGLEPVTFRPRAGDVLIWHGQLLHGGLPIRDPSRTRQSIVTHYFRACDSPPRLTREFKPGRFFLKRDHPVVTT